MTSDLIIPAQLSLYMVGTTLVRVVVYLVGIFLVARMAPIKTGSKIIALLVVTTLLMGWPLFMISLARDNVFRIDANTSFPPLIAVAVIIPVVIGYLAFRYWDTWRKIVYSIPQYWLIGIQVFRITGGVILLLYFRGLLPAEFAVPIGLGDLFIGVTAIPVAYFYYKQKPWSHKLSLVWNYVGIVDFLLAVPLGILTSPGPIHLLALDAPNLLTTTYPVVLFPLFSVPIGLILHIYSLARLNRKEESAAKTETQSNAWRVLAFFGVATFIYAVVFYFIFPLVTGRPLGFQIHEELQKTFAAHKVGLYFHIIPSMVAILLGPFQFLTKFRNNHLKLHRWIGRFYLGGVLFGGLAGLYMAQFSFSGPAAQMGFGLLAIAWLFSGYMAYHNIRKGRVEAHQEWMMRSYALTLAATTLRIYTRSFIALGLQAPDFHYINAWLCWVPNLLIAEYIIYRGRARRGEAGQTLPAATGSQPG